MDSEKLLILLGLGAIGYLCTSSMNDDDESEYKKQRREYVQQNECYFPESGNSNNNCVTGPIISYQNDFPSMQTVEQNVSPLAYGNMVQENFVNSDYVNLGAYSQGAETIPTYDENTGKVSLPVGDMTDVAAGEDNKYIYDRTIGTIGFTSTKIGGRRRGMADYIRGDLSILPDRNPSFQVSPDVSNTLLEGALGNQNALAAVPPQSIINIPTSSTASAPATAEEDDGLVQGQAMRRVVVRGAEVGQCDDEVYGPGKPNENRVAYADCLYNKLKAHLQKTGQQPSMEELKYVEDLRNYGVTTSYSGAGTGIVVPESLKGTGALV